MTLEQSSSRNEVLNSLQRLGISQERPLKIAWFSYFPIEWQTHVPEEFRSMLRKHPGTWLSVLLSQFEGLPWLDLHLVIVRKDLPRSLTFKRQNVTFHCLKPAAGLRLPTLYWLDTFLVNGVLRRIQPDLVHAWGSEFSATSIAARLPYPNLVTMQGIFTWLKDVYPLNRYQKVSAFLEKRALRKLRHVTAESSFSMRFLKEHWPNLQLQQVEHAPNPVFHLVRRQPQLNPKKIICVSSFTYGKGVDVLLLALDRLSRPDEFTVTFIGGGAVEFEQELRGRVRPEVWQRCSFKNNLTPEQLAEELATATFAVYPTRADNSPNAVKEAVVAGVPVIASRIGGIVDYVWRDKNGLLFEVGDVEQCAQAIQTAATHPLFSKGLVDPESLGKLREYLSAETMGTKMLKAYAIVLGEARGKT